MPPALFFLIRIVLAIRVLFWFHMKLEVVFSSSGHWQPDGDSVESINYFGQYGHYHNVDSSHHEHGMFLYLFVSSLISLNSGL